MRQNKKHDNESTPSASRLSKLSGYGSDYFILGRVASRNAQKTLTSVHQLAVESMNLVTPERWANAIRLAIKQEDLYLGKIIQDM